MSDQQNGSTQPPHIKAHMPNLRRLTDHGAAFSQAYCPSPHCCPSRASFFSGLYPSEHGVWNNVDVANTLSRGLYDQVRLFSEDLQDNGYQLFFSGKWHVSAEEGPDDRGFELVHHLSHQNKQYARRPNLPDATEWKHYGAGKTMCNPALPRQAGEIKREGYPAYLQYGANENPFQDRDVVMHANHKLEEVSADRPFFMYVGTLGPHDPYTVPQQYLDLYNLEEITLPASFSDDLNDKPALYRRTRDRFSQLTPEEHRESLRHYLAFCTYQDALFGQLVDTLERRELLEDTIVIYVSDHGDYMGSHGLWAKGLPAFQEAYHICSAIGYGGIPARKRVYDQFVSLADYAPTILELAGISTDRHFTGKSLCPFLGGQAPADWRDTMYTQTNGNELYGIQRAVFDRKYKYVFNGFDYDELYDLEQDPLEQTNIIGREGCRPVVREMSRRMWQFAHEHQDNIVNPYIMTALADYGPGILFPQS